MTNEHRTVEIVIDGMDCGNCALGIERKLKTLGVHEPSVNFASATATFGLAPGRPLEPIVSALESLGYGVRDRRESAPPRPLFSLGAKTALCALLTTPLMAGHLVPGGIHELHSPLLQLALTVPVFAIGLLHFGGSAIRSLRTGLANMDVLIVIGIIASFGYSLYGTIFDLGPEFLFYETTAAITTLVLLGNLIEARSVRRTSSAIEELARLQPPKAKRVADPSQPTAAVEIDAHLIEPGEILLVNTGDQIPTDGEIIWGGGSINEAIISGESIPVDKAVGASVIGGTIVVSGSLNIRAAAVGEETVLARIIKLVKDAQTNKPSIQQLGDRVSAVFVPTTIVLAVLTFCITAWGLNESCSTALVRAVAVLVIACPCAMGLATPTAVMVGVGRAAKLGILLKGGRTLEEFAGVKTIVFDKTGTLTTGDFQVANLTVEGRSEEEVRSIILALERHSSHPIAQSLVRAFAGAAPLHLEDVREEKGFGMVGRSISGERFTLGSPRLVGIPRDDAPPGTLVLLANDNVIARLILADDLKPNARAAIDALRLLGVTPVLLSGDAMPRCTEVGRALGIERIYGEHTPADKLRVIEAIDRESPSAFVGDGVNDAPGLARASVGISLSSGTTVAIESARVVLLGGSLERLPTALRLARETLRTIKQNLFWAFSYNIIAIPLAAAGYLTPMVAAIAMGFSDVMTIGNSIRLRHKRLE